MVDARVLGNREIRAERQFLEDATDAELMGGADRIGGLTRSRNEDFTVAWFERSSQHIHQRRFAGAVVPDKTDAFSLADGEVDSVEGMDGAEMLLDAVQIDNYGLLIGHYQPAHR